MLGWPKSDVGGLKRPCGGIYVPCGGKDEPPPYWTVGVEDARDGGGGVVLIGAVVAIGLSEDA